MVKFYSTKQKTQIPLIKIGFRTIFDAKRAMKYLGKNEVTPVALSMEISEHQKQVLDDIGISYYVID